MAKTFVSRRDVLTSGLAGVAGLRLLPFFPNAARAATAPPPRRLLLVFHFGGFLETSFFPALAANGQDWTLGETMTALSPYKQHLIFPDGLEHRGVMYEYSQEGMDPNKVQLDNEHGGGINSVFTGSKITRATNFLSSGPSIDRVVANALYAANPTKYRTLDLGVFAGSGSGGHDCCFFSAPGTPVIAQNSPQAAFNTLFKDFQVSSPAFDEAAATRSRKRKQSVIDAVRGDLNQLCTRIGKAEKQKCDAHLSALRDLEFGLQSASMNHAPACVKPAAPPVDDGSDKAALANIHTQMDIIASAFTCDLTRVATLQIGHGDGGFDEIAGIGHHETTHAVGDKRGEQKFIDDHKKIDRYYADRFAYLLQKLDSIKEADGTSVLENTLILSGHDTTTRSMPGKEGPHTGERSPLFLAGGRNFAFKTGRYLQLAKPNAVASFNPRAGAFVPHNRMLVSIGRAFGLDINTFGTLDNSTGGLPML